MRPFATLSRVEFALLMREPAAVLFTLGLPVVLLMLNGGNGNRPEPALVLVHAVDGSRAWPVGPLVARCRVWHAWLAGQERVHR